MGTYEALVKSEIEFSSVMAYNKENNDENNGDKVRENE